MGTIGGVEIMEKIHGLYFRTITKNISIDSPTGYTKNVTDYHG